MGGWAEGGFLPRNQYFGGFEGASGFFHTVFYKVGGDLVEQIYGEVGLNASDAPSAAMLDMCEWNYAQSASCAEGFDCKRVRAHHRPDSPGSDPRECMKTALQK